MIPAIVNLARIGISGASKGAKYLSKFFKRKPSKTKTSKPKSEIRKENQRKVKKWYERISDWFLSNSKETQENQRENEAKITSINEQNPTKNPKPNKIQEFIPKRFFYKNERFSDNKVLNEVLNDLNKKNKLRQHRIDEIENKIDFTFNELLTKDIQKVRQEFKANLAKNNFTVSKFPEPEPLENESSNIDFYGDNNDKKPKKSFKRRLKEFRVKLRNKFKSVKNKFNSFKDKIKTSKPNLKRLNPFKKVLKPKPQINTKPKEQLKKPEQPKKPSIEKPKEPLKEVKTPEKPVEKQKEFTDTKPKTDNAKVPQAKQSKYPDLENDLSEVKDKELELKNKLKKLDDNYNKKSLKIDDELSEIKQKLNNKPSFSETIKLRAKQAKLKAEKTKLKSSHFLKTSFEKGKGFAKQLGKIKNVLSDKVSNLTTQLKNIFPKMFKFSSKGINALKPFVKKLPLIGSVLNSILSLIDINSAKNAYEVRKALGSGIGGLLGTILGGALGSFLPLIGNVVFGILGGVLGELLGKVAIQYGLEPSDFLSFDLYNAPIEEKQFDVINNYNTYRNELYSWSEIDDEIEKTKTNPELLKTSNKESSISVIVKKSVSDSVETISNTFDNENQDNKFSSINPKEIEGSVVKVVREKQGIDWLGRGFVSGHLYVIDGSGKTIFKANTTERPNEGTTPNRKLRIPAGTYNMFWGGGSKHPDRPVLYNDQVPASRAIMIHKGNSVAWSEGCVVISFGNPWSGVIGKTGEKSDAEKAGYQLMLALKALQGLDPNKRYFGKELPIKTQIFNNFSSGDLSAGKKAKGSETYQEAPQETLNRTIENNTVIVVNDEI